VVLFLGPSTFTTMASTQLVNSSSPRAWLLKSLTILVGIAGAVSLLVVTGPTTAAPSAPSDGPLAFTSKFGHRSPVASPGASPERMLLGVLNRFRGSRITSARVGTRPFIQGLRPGVWLHFVVGVPAPDERANRARWEADIIVGALADALAQTARPGISGATIEGSLPDNTIIPDLGGGMGDIVPGQEFLDSSDASMKQDLAELLAAAGLTPVSVDVLRADQPAPAVVAETAHPREAAAAAAQTIRSLFGQAPPKYEGYYFELRDTSGQRLFTTSAAFRSGVGRLWVSPSIADVVSLTRTSSARETQPSAARH
jgi:hypothetical protein